MNSFDYEFFSVLYSNILDVYTHLHCVLYAYFNSDELTQSEKDEFLSALFTDVDLIHQCSDSCSLLVTNLPKSFSFAY